MWLPFLSPPILWQPLSYFLSLRMCIFCTLLINESYNRRSFVTGLFIYLFIFAVLGVGLRASHKLGKHSTTELYPSPYLKCFLRFTYVIAKINTSFLSPNNIPLYGYTIFCLSIHQLMDIRVVSTFWLLWVKLLWAFVYGSLWGHMLSFLWKGITGS